MSTIQLVWRNLLYERARTMLCVAGVAFAVVMQLGLLGAARNTTQLFDHLDFDLLVVSTDYLDLNHPGDIPRARLAPLRGFSAVEAVTALSAGPGLWRDARGEGSALLLGVEPARVERIFAGPPRAIFGGPPQLERTRTALGRLDAVLLDNGPSPGAPGQLNDRHVEVVGDFRLGSSFGYTALLLTNEESFARLTGRSAERVTFGLVRLKRGSNPARARKALQAVLPPEDARILTREEIKAPAPAGRRFLRLASFVALLIALVFVQQVVAGGLRKLLPACATLQALGYGDSFLARLVLAQALVLALLGSLLGLFGAFAFSALARPRAHDLTAERAAFVLALTVGASLVSGLLALRTIHATDPAEVHA